MLHQHFARTEVPTYTNTISILGPQKYQQTQPYKSLEPPHQLTAVPNDPHGDPQPTAATTVLVALALTSVSNCPTQVLNSYPPHCSVSVTLS